MIGYLFQTDVAPELLHEVPHATKISRPDDVPAAGKPIVRGERT